MSDIKPIKTVDLDALFDTASRYRRLREPLIAITAEVDFDSGMHGEDTVLNYPDNYRAVRPWRAITHIYETADGDHGIGRAENVPARRQRGFVRIPSVAISSEYHDPDRIANQFLIVRSRDRWMVAAQMWTPLRNGPVWDEEQHLTTDIHFGLLLTDEYCWHAVFRRPRHAPLSITTDARGALALFRLRDKPDDVKRRPALRHWVSEHVRRRQSTDPVPVSEHLRGITRFDWSGIDVELVPSLYDQERAAKARRVPPTARAR